MQMWKLKIENTRGSIANLVSCGLSALGVEYVAPLIAEPHQDSADLLLSGETYTKACDAVVAACRSLLAKMDSLQDFQEDDPELDVRAYVLVA